MRVRLMEMKETEFDVAEDTIFHAVLLRGLTNDATIRILEKGRIEYSQVRGDHRTASN